jgi:hypothetical protein
VKRFLCRNGFPTCRLCCVCPEQGFVHGMSSTTGDPSDTEQRAAEPCIASLYDASARDVHTALPNAKRGRNRLDDTRKDSNASTASYASTEPDWCQIPYDGTDVAASQLRSRAVAGNAAVGVKQPQRPLSPPSLRSSTSPSRAGTSARRLEGQSGELSSQKVANLRQAEHEEGSGYDDAAPVDAASSSSR